MQILYGSDLAISYKNKIKEEVALIQNRKPHLCVILVGNNPASLSYIKSKKKAALEVGIDFSLLELPGDIKEDALLNKIYECNSDPDIDGLLVQMPLPGGINEKNIMNAIDPDKDVDGLNAYNAGKLMLNEEGFRPCTPLGIMALLKETGIDLKAKRAVVLGRSNLVGLPIARMLIAADATVTVCHSKTNDLRSITSMADILIVAIGKAKFIKKEDIKENAIVIDVGINRIDGHLVGDVDYDDIKDKCQAITPVPKGVGPMTVVMLLSNTLKAYKRKYD